jgi:hypothetical protein
MEPDAITELNRLAELFERHERKLQAQEIRSIASDAARDELSEDEEGRDADAS